MTAKFFVEDIVQCDIPGTDHYATITMKPVFGTYAGGDDEGTNKYWSKWTPIGGLSIAITDPAAIDNSRKTKPTISISRRSASSSRQSGLLVPPRGVPAAAFHDLRSSIGYSV